MTVPAEASSVSVSETFGRFISGSSWSQLPAALKENGKRALLNFIACAIGSAHAGPVEAAAVLLADYSGPARATLIGRTERLDPLAASFVNAISANLLDYDDTHLETMIHPTSPVAAACLAMGESLGSSGEDLLHALILGIEVECRIGVGVSPGHYPRGWHITSTCGVFGAAAAGARLLGLSASRTAHALGLAASQSAGILENLPTAGKNISVGNAPRNGLFAALAAKAGYEAAPKAIEGPLGWARTMGDIPKVDAMIGNLGSRWEFMRNTYKPYPSGIVFHAVIDACLAMREAEALKPDQIQAVTVRGNALFVALGDRDVASAGDARVSIQHNAAVALLFGKAGMREFALATAFDPEVAAFRSKVSVVLAADMPRGTAEVTLTLTDGRTVVETVEHPIGSESRPLTNLQIEDKVREAVAHNPARGGVEAIVDAVWTLDQTAGIGPLMALLAGL